MKTNQLTTLFKYLMFLVVPLKFRYVVFLSILYVNYKGGNHCHYPEFVE